MEKIDLAIAMVTLFVLSFSTKRINDSSFELKQLHTDTIPCDIKELKKENISLNQKIGEKISKKDHVVVREVVKKPSQEVVYLRIDGVVYEFLVTRDSKSSGFIIDIDSFMATNSTEIPLIENSKYQHIKYEYR